MQTYTFTQAGMLLCIGIGVIVIAIWMLRRASKAFHVVEKYEFENRTDGGVVQFTSYEASLAHQARRGRAGCSVQVAAILGLVGVSLLGMSQCVYGKAQRSARSAVPPAILAKQAEKDRIARASYETARGGCFSPANCGEHAVPPCEVVCSAAACERRGYGPAACRKDCVTRCGSDSKQ